MKESEMLRGLEGTETIKDYIAVMGKMDIEDAKTGWKFWSDGKSLIGGKFKVRKDGKQQIL